MVAGYAPSGWCAFKIGLNEGRSSVAAVSIASINYQGIVFSPALGQVDPHRYKWTEFSAEGLKDLQQVLPRERAFQQKPGTDKAGYLRLISELRKFAPQRPAAPIPIPVKPNSPPVIIVQAVPAVVAPAVVAPAVVAPAVVAPVAPAPKTKKSPSTVPSALPNKQPEFKAENEVETVPVFQLIQPAGTTPSADHRPPESGLSFAVIFSPAGIFLVLVVIGFSVYAGNEIARFRNHPKILVCAISALFPVIGPIIFLLLPDPAAKYADAMAEASDPFLIKRPDKPPTTEMEAPAQIPKEKYEEDLDSSYMNFNQSDEETHLEKERAPTLVSGPEVVELYRALEYQFDFEFFNQYFQRFVNSQPNDGQVLILRTHDLVYPVHHITQLSPDSLNIIYPSGDEWLENTIEYKALEEVEITFLKS